ncbi:MAG: sugar phosphate isomerase/epimerase [Limnochordia bacterium]|jgi:sugar phosphate isomerase/epimerase|nr:sugar phosphate isomerase/epimerase [Limnochordia bacterium]
MSRFGIIHYNAPGKNLEEFADYAQKVGYKYVELAIADIWDERRETEAQASKRAVEVRSLLEKRNLQVSVLSAANDFVMQESGVVQTEIKRMKTVCHLARLLGTDVIRTEGGQPKKHIPKELWADAISSCLKKLKGFVEDEGYYLAVDNHGLVTNDIDLQLRILEEVNSPNIGANFDTMNYRWFGYELSQLHQVYARIAPHVLHTHLKDGIGTRGSYQGCALGRGEIDLVFAVKCLKDVGYEGVWCVEYEGSDPVGGYEESFRWLESHITK